MLNVEYEAKVLPDGHLSCPESIKEKLRLSNGTEVKVIIMIEEIPPAFYKSLARTEKKTGFCGVWQDDREAEEIVQDIYSNRRGFKEVVL